MRWRRFDGQRWHYLYKEGGVGSKSARDQAYVDAMATAYAAYPDDETKLFYGLALLATVKEGSKGFERQGLAAKLFEEVYAHAGLSHCKTIGRALDGRLWRLRARIVGRRRSQWRPVA